MSDSYRRIVLKRHIEGLPSAEDFALETAPLPEPGEGEMLIRTLYASIDPGTRSRLSPGPAYRAPLAPGDTVGAFNVGEVVRSRHPRYRDGDLVACTLGWTEAGLSNGRGYLARIEDRDLPASVWIGILGVPGLTAYFGLTRVGEIAAGKTVVVTSAAGMVGASAAQIARNLDCRVVAIAGGAEKCRWLRESAGIEAVIDRKAEPDLAAAVARHCPDGVDILFDNVGNASVDAILPAMAMNGRVVVSGQVGDYNLPKDAVHGIVNTRPFITHRVRMEGFVVFDDLKQFAGAQARLAAWLREGALVYREIFHDGVAAAPGAFRGVFEGRDFGRHIVRMRPDAEAGARSSREERGNG